MHRRRVVVTGIGALTPIGNTKNAFWGGLLSGTSGAAPITYFDASMFKTQFAWYWVWEEQQFQTLIGQNYITRFMFLFR